MALCVVVLDVGELCGVLEGWYIPVQISKPLVNIGVTTANISDVCLSTKND